MSSMSSALTASLEGAHAQGKDVALWQALYLALPTEHRIPLKHVEVFTSEQGL